MSNIIAVGTFNSLKKKPQTNMQQTIQQCCQERKGGWWWADLGGHVMATRCKPRQTAGWGATCGKGPYGQEVSLPLSGHQNASTNAAPQAAVPYFLPKFEISGAASGPRIGSFEYWSYIGQKTGRSWFFFLKSICSCLDPKLVHSLWY